MKDIKFCNKCKTNKHISCFHKSKAQKDGLVSVCKSCKKIYKHKWDIKNKEKMKTYFKEYRIKNLDKKRQSDKEYYKNNKDRLLSYRSIWAKNNRERINKRHHERNKTDIQYKLNRAVRSRFNQAFRSIYTGGVAIRNLGCSIKELELHLESQFQEGMSWDNYGVKGWHIDHIIPLDYFELDDPTQILVACYYKNLQPLWAVDNLKKGNKVG